MTLIKRRTQKDGLPRLYPTPDGEFVSVTSVLSALSKHALLPWAVNLEREFCVRVAKDVIKEMNARSIRPNLMNFDHALRKGLGDKKAHQLFVEKMADLGTAAHGAVEASLKMLGGVQSQNKVTGDQEFVPLSGPSANAWRQWFAWKDSVELSATYAEEVVWSKRHRYAGTLDCAGEVNLPKEHGGGRVWAVLDWKTGNAIWKESYLQNVAYIVAAKERRLALGTGDVWGVIVRLPKYEGDPPLEAVWIPPGAQPKLFDAFLGVQTAYEFQRERDPLRVTSDAWDAAMGQQPALFDDVRHVELEEE